MTDEAKRFVDVEITKETPRTSVAGFGILLVITGSTTLTTTTRVKRFSDVESVKTYFGENSEEHKAADAFFFQDPFLVNQPEEIVFGRYDEAGETPEECITALEAKDPDWATLAVLKDFRDDSDARGFATAIESRKKTAVFATNDVNTLTLGDITSFAYYLKDANYKRTAAIYYDDTTIYPCMSWLGQQLPKPVGSTNWSFKTLAGTAQGAMSDIDASLLTQAQIDAALDVNCNVYTGTMGSNFIYFGTMGGGRDADNNGEFIDIIRNIDFLTSRVKEGMMSLLLEKDIIPFTNGGITICDNRLKSILQVYGVDQKILEAGTVVTTFPKRSSVPSATRAGRSLPGGTFTAELRGAINTITIRGTVSI